MDTCPNCGYCKHCGRANFTPWYPIWVYQTPQPWYPYQPWVTTGGDFTISTSSGSSEFSFNISNFPFDESDGSVGATLH